MRRIKVTVEDLDGFRVKMMAEEESLRKLRNELTEIQPTSINEQNFFKVAIFSKSSTSTWS